MQAFKIGLDAGDNQVVSTSSIMQIYCPQHPLVGHWLAVCRNKISPPPIFRQAIAELGRILIYEASQDWLPTLKGQIETPLGTAECRFIDPQKPVKVEPLYPSCTTENFKAAPYMPAQRHSKKKNRRERPQAQFNLIRIYHCG